MDAETTKRFLAAGWQPMTDAEIKDFNDQTDTWKREQELQAAARRAQHPRSPEIDSLLYSFGTFLKTQDLRYRDMSDVIDNFYQRMRGA